MDKIQITALPVKTIIGTLPHERTSAQEIMIHADLYGDFSKAAKSDDFPDTFDYSAVEKSLHDLAERSSFHLLEALADHLAVSILKEQPLIRQITLQIDKPSAPQYAKCISIQVTRSQE